MMDDEETGMKDVTIYDDKTGEVIYEADRLPEGEPGMRIAWDEQGTFTIHLDTVE